MKPPAPVTSTRAPRNMISNVHRMGGNQGQGGLSAGGENARLPDAEMVEVLHVIDSLGEGGAENNLLSILRRMPPDRFRNHVAWLHDRENLVEAMRPHVASLIRLYAPRSTTG